MAPDVAPPEVIALADARSAARRAKDWDTADALRAQIEAAGWKVVDTAFLYSLGARLRRTSSMRRAALRHERPARLAWTRRRSGSPRRAVATDWPDDIARAMAAIAGRSPRGAGIIVANGPSEAQQAAPLDLEAAATGKAGTSIEVGGGRAPGARDGVERRHSPRHGAVIVLVDASVEPPGGLVGPLAAAWTPDRRRRQAVRAGVRRPAAVRGAARRDDDVVTIEGYAQRSARRLRGSWPARRAFRVLPQPRHMVEPRPPRSVRGGQRGSQEDDDGSDGADAIMALAAMPAPRRAVCVPGVEIIRQAHRAGRRSATWSASGSRSATSTGCSRARHPARPVLGG